MDATQRVPPTRYTRLRPSFAGASEGYAGQVDAPVLRDRDVGAGGNLGRSGSGLDERLYYATDFNMNVTAVMDGNSTSGTFGQVVERYAYDPYGRVSVAKFLNGPADKDSGVSDWSADADGFSDVDSAILFCGYWRDAETGLYHIRRRMYHPLLGRWLQRDPLGYVDGMSLNEYCVSAPTWSTDPLGELVIYAEGAVSDPSVQPKAPGLFKLSEQAAGALLKWAVDTDQRFLFASHTEGTTNTQTGKPFTGAWNEMSQIEFNAKRIFDAIMTTPEERIYIFAHSTGSAAVMKALELLYSHNLMVDRIWACMRPVLEKAKPRYREAWERMLPRKRFITCLVIYGGSAIRDYGLPPGRTMEILAGTTDVAFFLRGGRDAACFWAGVFGGADQKPFSFRRSYGQPPESAQANMHGRRASRFGHETTVYEYEIGAWDHIDVFRPSGTYVEIDAAGTKVTPGPSYVQKVVIPLFQGDQAPLMSLVGGSGP